MDRNTIIIAVVVAVIVVAGYMFLSGGETAAPEAGADSPEAEATE